MSASICRIPKIDLEQVREAVNRMEFDSTPTSQQLNGFETKLVDTSSVAWLMAA